MQRSRAEAAPLSVVPRSPVPALGDRRGWDEALASAEHDDPRGDRPLALLVVGLAGLEAGGEDRVRRSLAAVRGTARRGDVVARLGPAELGLLLHRAGDGAAQAVADRVRSAVEGSGAGLSATVGVAVRHPGERLHDLWRRADVRAGG